MIVVKFLVFKLSSDFINLRNKIVYHHQPKSKVSFEKNFMGRWEKYLELSFESDCVSPAILEKQIFIFSSIELMIISLFQAVLFNNLNS